MSAPLRQKDGTKNGGAKPSAPLVLRLYVAGAAPLSRRATQNLKALIARPKEGVVHLEVVDVLVEPSRAIQDGVLVTPMLVKASPAPKQVVIGDLSDIEAVRKALGLDENG